jgi:hypothetical protein
MPLESWAAVNETGDLRHLYKKYRKSYSPSYSDLSLWFTLQDQKIEEFGYPGDYKEYLETKKDWALNMCEYLITGDRSIKTIAAIQEQEVEELFSKEEAVKTRKVVGYLQKHYKMHISMRNLSVYEYYNLIETMQEYYG